ncbi:MAG: aminomethyl transferase family protein, partial [Candidatus Cloacimonetes bacterium]|nr:aminomethyl transferase family protein [Candidatus Cloacimonadota bacterium]
MKKIGFDFPEKPRKTALYKVEDWYQHHLAERLDREYQPIKRSNFGEYDMAVNYLTSVLEEAKAIEKVAIFNIDHMAQIQFTGKDAVTLLDRVLPANIAGMRIGQCKYTLLLTEKGTVIDDLIIMRLTEDNFIMVINAGHD